MIERYFKLAENQTTVRRELLGGLTTFMTMAYIIVVNPQILSQAGMPADGVLFATCISAAAASLVMGLYANYPIAMAPGMSLNAYFTYSVCLGMHIPWRTALGVVFFSGVLFIVLTVTRVREQIVNGIPDCLKHSTAAGIGMFIAFVGMRSAKLVVANTATFVGIGNFSDPEVQAACLGLVLTLVLMVRKVTGAILLGILGTTLYGIFRGMAHWPASLFALPHPSGTFLQLDLQSAAHLGLLEITFAFLFVDLFDNVGTLVGVCEQAGFVKQGKIPGVGRALLADAVGTVFGSLTGTSTVTSYIESAAGVAVGAHRPEQRSGRSAVSRCGVVLSGGNGDSGICNRPGPDSRWRTDDAIHRQGEVGGIHGCLSGIRDHGGHAADLQHCNRPEPRADFFHGGQDCGGEIPRGEHPALDPRRAIHPALHLSRGSLTPGTLSGCSARRCLIRGAGRAWGPRA